MAGTASKKRAAKSPPTTPSKPAKKQQVLSIDTPPFPSPGKKNAKALKQEKSAKSNHKFYFERLGDGNMYLFWVEKPSGEGGFIYPIDIVVQSSSKEGKEWRQHTNCICPTLSRRQGRHMNVPLPAKFAASLEEKETSYPWRCFFGYKTEEIPHDQYVTYVMQQAVKVISKNSKYSTSYMVDVHKSDTTPSPTGPYRALDEVLIDRAVQTVIYRHFYQEHLTDSNFDKDMNSYVVPEEITTNFTSEHAELSEHFFTRHNDKYSFTAKFFGYRNTRTSDQIFNDPEKKNEQNEPSTDETPHLHEEEDGQPDNQDGESEAGDDETD